ncbi:hypothetical protein H4Q26_008548 [Puccinia striiformis f. sp. tritici PST-130]|nr:hypothetical protein H4Q26_008548 [Puccinia striiformis f. sp. tritici PST-130]
MGIFTSASDFPSVAEFEAFKASCKIKNSFDYFFHELIEYFTDFHLYNHDPQWREGRETQTLSSAELHAQDASLIELRTTVLPSLRQKLIHLCESIDVPDLGENPMPNLIEVLNLVREIRPCLEALNTFLDFLALIVFDLCQINQTNDHNRQAKTAIDIDKVIEFAKQSDFELIQQGWRVLVNGLESNLIGLTTQIDSANQLQQTDHTQSDHGRPQDNSLRQHIAQLARSTVPLVKLARLYLNKLSNTTITKLPFRIEDTMSSAEIGALQNSTSLLYASISTLTQSLVWIYDHNNLGGQIESIRQFGIAPLTAFDSSIIMLSFHLVPTNPTLAWSGNLFKAWFSDLRSQFNLAWVNVVIAINVFESVTQRL